MQLANLFSMMQMQNNAAHNQQVGLEVQVLTRQGSADPGGEAQTRMNAPVPDTQSLSLPAQVEQSRAQMDADGKDFSDALKSLTPQQRSEIEQRAQADLENDKKSEFPPADGENGMAGYRYRAAMNFATDNLKNSLSTGAPIDDNVNRLFTSGSRYGQSSMQCAVLSAQNQDDQQMRVFQPGGAGYQNLFGHPPQAQPQGGN